MQKALFFKAVLVAIVFAVLLIPLSMIRGIVGERAARQQSVVEDVAASSFGKQVFAGLILALPYAEEYDEETGDGRERKIERRHIERTLRLFPATSELDGFATVATKHRGLFKVRTFNWQTTVRGEFVLDGRVKFDRTRENSHIIWGPPKIGLGLSDPRGFVGAPTLEWAGQPVQLERGSGIPGFASGLHATASYIDPTKPQRLPYALALSVQGTESLTVVPVADNNSMSLSSDWPHPSFGGQFLPQPESERIGEAGFTARWIVTSLASNTQQQVEALLGRKGDAPPSVERIEVRFVDPIDIYSLSDRALKYAFLFIGLTFGAFLLFEVLKGLPIHPAQYGLVGMGLATFFLLLIALSEHIAFWIAYLIAATACIALLGFYLSAVLHSVNRGLSFSLILTGLYGSLYGLLISEDNALLLGSLLVFAILAAAMLMTRKVNWYAVGSNRAEARLA
jgi:inner membrane protein